MRIPRYWAEARSRRRERGRQVTVRRFGWSDASIEDAQLHAQQRADEALQQAWSNERVPRREVKVPYNGAEGMPIREEIIAEHGSTIITRNSYGALCLNTPDVLFVDIDHGGRQVGCGVIVGAFVVALAPAIAVGAAADSALLAAIVLLIAAPVGMWLGMLLLSLWRRLRGGQEAIALARVETLVQQQPASQFRVYRTPAGMRVLGMHKPFDPRGDEAQQLFSALGTDPMYVTMCRRQACFRARVSPKPWRIGIERHLKPRPGVWPIGPERLPDRYAWVEQYERAAQDYAACEYLTTIGSGVPHSTARAVQELHDRLCRAESGLPIA